ncbi:MAG TPA: hypothetical protein VMX17_11645 [Candidatus Glassbacteria bacterium]|nr:hypothetical protein [Candidatus Glassbacteria bacterium]
MTPERMKNVGSLTYNVSWSDQELQEQIKALKLVIAYLEGRGDSKILLFPLRIELDRFEDFTRSRRSRKA